MTDSNFSNQNFENKSVSSNDLEQTSSSNKNTNITATEINNAVHQILASGEDVSVSKIRAIIGHGSYTTISKTLKALNIYTPRLQKFKNNEASFSKKLEEENFILEELNNEQEKLRIKLSILEDELNHEKESQLNNLKCLNNLEIIKNILLNHLANNPDLIATFKECGIKHLVDFCHQNSIQKTYSKVQIEEITNFIDIAKNIINSVDIYNYIGNTNSINAIIAMLENELKKIGQSNNEQAYHF